jgi:hypothetical protein
LNSKINIVDNIDNSDYIDDGDNIAKTDFEVEERDVTKMKFCSLLPFFKTKYGKDPEF